MTSDDYRDSLAVCIAEISAEVGCLSSAIYYEAKHSDLALISAQIGAVKLRHALDRLDALNVRFSALGEAEAQDGRREVYCKHDQVRIPALTLVGRAGFEPATSTV